MPWLLWEGEESIYAIAMSLPAYTHTFLPSVPKAILRWLISKEGVEANRNWPFSQK